MRGKTKGRLLGRKATAVLLALTLLLAAGSPIYAGGAPETPDQVTIGVLARPISDALRPFLDEFEQETGIRVELEQHSADALHDKTLLGVASNAGYFDIVYLSPSWIGNMVENNYLLRLDDYYDEYGFELDDFVGAAVDMVYYEGAEGKWGVPYVADTKVLMYRKDLFADENEQAAFYDEYGYELRVPETMNELRDTAAFFTRPDDGLYGYGAPMMGALNWVWALTKIWTFGGDIYDENYNVIIDSPESLDAWIWAQEMLQYMPEGVLAWEYGEHLSYMTGGRLAMTEGYYQFGVDVNDPEKSDMAGQIGYALLPRAEGSGFETGKHVIGGGALAIPHDAPNPDGAFKFLQWMFAEDIDRSIDWYLAGGAPTRAGVFESPRVYEEAPWLEDLHPIALKSLDEVAVSRPVIPEAYEILDAIIDSWSSVATGDRNVEQALSSAQQEIDRILEPRRR